MGPAACALAPLAAAAVLACGAAAAATEIQRVVSPGGVEAWLVEDRSVPVVSLSFSFAGGAALDPEGKEGLAELVSGLLDEGAGGMDSRAFQQALEDVAASLRFSAGLDRFDGTLRSLSAHRDRAFGLLRLALAAPRFDEEPVERIRAQLVAALESRKDDPRRIARRAWYAAAFDGHPYARPVSGSPESLRAIAREDLARFARDRLVRGGLAIGAAGDVSAPELARQLDRTFGALPAQGAPSALPEAVFSPGRLTVVRKPVPQSVIVFGQAGLKRGDPDYYAAYVMNHILGGGSSSRLNAELREKRGLVYSVYSYLNPLDRAGLVMGGLGTANAQAGAALALVRSEWRRLAEEGAAARELADAKTYLNGSFPLRLDSTGDVAAMLTAVQVNRLGIDYLDRRASLIDAVAAADVKRLARRLLDPDALTVVVVGDPEGIAPAP